MARSAILCAAALFITSTEAYAQSADAEQRQSHEHHENCGRSLWIAGAALLPSGIVLDSVTIVGALMAGSRGGRIAAEVGFMVGIAAIVVGTVALAIGLTRRARCRRARAGPRAFALGCSQLRFSP